jgi:hypothetical protein
MVGLLLRQEWARRGLFVCAAVGWLSWWWPTIAEMRRGLPHYGRVTEVVGAFLPGVAWLALWAVMAFLVRKPFRAPDPSGLEPGGTPIP